MHVDLHGSSISWRFSWLWLKWFLSALILMVFQDVLTKSIEVVLKHWRVVYYMMESAIHPKRVRDPVQEREAFCSGLQVVVVQQESLVERIVLPHTLVDGECWRWSFCHNLSSIPGSCQCCGGLAVEDLTACASASMNSAALFELVVAIAVVHVAQVQAKALRVVPRLAFPLAINPLATLSTIPVSAPLPIATRRIRSHE